jgi:hypothetical protein
MLANHGPVVAGAKVAIENSRFVGNGSSGLWLQVFRASVTRSVASENAQYGIQLTSGETQISETAADSNSQPGFFLSGNLSSVLLNSAEASSNGTAGLSVASGSVALIRDSVLEGSGGAVGVQNNGITGTFKNNFISSVTGNDLNEVFSN